MKFRELAKYFEKIEHTSSRLEITYILAELFQFLSSEEIDKTLYLLQGRIAPLFNNLEFAMAEKMVLKSIATALNCEQSLFESTYKKNGDLGQTVEQFRTQIQLFDEQKDLSIQEVYAQLLSITKSSGEGSQIKKINILAQLIRQLDPVSTRYVVRIPIGIMRLGFSDMTILDAFSWMIQKDKQLRTQIQEAYHVRPDIGYIGKILKENGIQGIQDVKPVVGTPIIMMRAERMSSGSEIIKQIGTCASQPKYDGFRLQIHYSKKENIVKIFSRNLEEVSVMFPDVIQGIKKEVFAQEVILEGEAIGFNSQTGTFLPFQETVQRKRKYDIDQKAESIPLKLFAFELLYVDGQSYVKSDYERRRKKLNSILKGQGNIFEETIILAPEKIIHSPQDIEIEFDDAISKGLEGIIAKKLNGFYQPGARGWNWIKYKKSYSVKVEDTIDCVIMGYDFGKGKRSDFGIGAFLVGIYDDKLDMFCTIAKIGTGLSDEEWKKLKTKSEKFSVKKIPRNYLVDKLMYCDVWISPSIVVEIRADEISRSPVHTAGRLLKQSISGSSFIVESPGFALRFPRLEKFRDDKAPTDATTLKEMKDIFEKQGSK